MSTKQYLDPKDDFVFKKLFGSQEHKSSLLSFLNAVLQLSEEKKIIDVEIRNPNWIVEVSGESITYLDILVQDAEGSKYIVEMQKNWKPDFIQRMHAYVGRTFSQGIKSKADYAKLTKVVLLAIIDAPLFKNKKNFISTFKMLDCETFENDLPYFNFVFIQLPKFTKTLDQLENNLDRWIYFLKHAEESRSEDEQVLKKQESVFQDAYLALDSHTWTEVEQSIFERKTRQQREHEEDLARSKAEGEVEGRIGIAVNLLKLGIEIENIALATGLSIDQIKQLQKK